MQSDLLHQLNPDQDNICEIQEPYLDQYHNSCTTPYWYTIHLKEHYVNLSKTRSLILVNKCITSDAWAQVDTGSPDVTAVQVHTDMGALLIVNIYNDVRWQDGLKVIRLSREKVCMVARPQDVHDTCCG